jgi:hypothetical protein
MAMACSPCPLPSVVDFSTTLVRCYPSHIPATAASRPLRAVLRGPNGPPLWLPLLSGHAQAAAAIRIDSTCGPPPSSPRARTWALESDALQLRMPELTCLFARTTASAATRATRWPPLPQVVPSQAVTSCHDSASSSVGHAAGELNLLLLQTAEIYFGQVELLSPEAVEMGRPATSC